MRAGKILIALTGGIKGYRPDTDAIHATLRRARAGSPDARRAAMLGRRARREVLFLQSMLRQNGLEIVLSDTDSGYYDPTQSFVMLMGPVPFDPPGEYIEIDASDSDGWLHAFTTVGRSPRRSIGCFKMMEPK